MEIHIVVRRNANVPVWAHHFCGNSSPKNLSLQDLGRGTQETCTREAQCVPKGNYLLVFKHYSPKSPKSLVQIRDVDSYPVNWVGAAAAPLAAPGRSRGNPGLAMHSSSSGPNHTGSPTHWARTGGLPAQVLRPRPGQPPPAGSQLTG